MAEAKKPAGPLYAMIALKLGVGLLLIVTGLALYSLRNANLQQELQLALGQANLGLGSFHEVNELFGSLTPRLIQLLAAGILLYGSLSLVHAAGLIVRAAWAGWIIILESAVFVPIELWDLVRHFSIPVLLVLAINGAICWYFVANRKRLFGKTVQTA